MTNSIRSTSADQPPEKPPPSSLGISPDIDVSFGVPEAGLPGVAQISQWVLVGLDGNLASVAVRVVSLSEMSQLNNDFRDQHKPTNVLSFPAQISDALSVEFLQMQEISDEQNTDISMLGDIAICAEVVANEAIEQGKTVESHWAHMIVHGVLHLRGFDHQTNTDAGVMEAEEIRLLQSLGFDNPYL